MSAFIAKLAKTNFDTDANTYLIMVPKPGVLGLTNSASKTTPA